VTLTTSSSQNTLNIDEKPKTYAHWTSLHTCIDMLLNHYFSELGDYEPKQLHNLVLEAVEIPLLKSVMRQCEGNQTRAATILGISRVTLRKKLAHYKLI